MLNQPRYAGASVLLARKNFGCGSSREHAPWALDQYGFRAIIAPSYADIFFNNSFKNGLLPIVLREAQVAQLFDETLAFPGYSLTIDLERQVVVKPDGAELAFEVQAFRKYCLLNGLDDIGLTLRQKDKIKAFEAERLATKPWLAHQPASADAHRLFPKTTSYMKIAVLPGDGIGTEIVAEAVRVLDALDLTFEMETALVGGAAYEAHGHPLPDATLKLAKEADAVLFGAVGDWKYDKLERPLRPEQAILGLRKNLGLFANFRPAICYEQLVDASSLKPELVAGLDILIIRELTGDIYFGQPRGRRTRRRRPLSRRRRSLRHDALLAPRDRTHRPRRLPGRAQAQQARDQRRQGQRAGDLPVLEGRRDRGRRGISGRRARPHVRRQRRHAAGQGAQEVRRGGHRQHVRRHPVGRGGDADRLDRHAALGVAERRATRACTSPATAARPTSPARASPILWLQSCPLP